MRMCVLTTITRCMCAHTDALLLYVHVNLHVIALHSYACLCSCVVVALQHFLNHRNLLEMQDVPCTTEHTHIYTHMHVRTSCTHIDTVGAISITLQEFADKS